MAIGLVKTSEDRAAVLAKRGKLERLAGIAVVIVGVAVGFLYLGG